MTPSWRADRLQKRRMKGKGAAKEFDGHCRNCGKYGRKSETCWATSSKQPEHGRKPVNVLDEQDPDGIVFLFF